MIDREDCSVVLIKSRGERRDIGSGFVIYQDESFSYVVTCAHVVKAVGGKDYVKVKGKDATVIAYSWENQEDSLDLAVIQVEKLDLPSLNIQPNAQVKDSFSIQGFFYFDPGKSIEIREVKGTLKQAKKFAIKEGDDFIDGWELEITSDNLLKEGYSGSPILSQQQEVIGVVTHLLENGSKGSAISIDALAKFWLEMPSELLSKFKVGGTQSLKKGLNATMKNDKYTSNDNNSSIKNHRIKYLQTQQEEIKSQIAALDQLISKCNQDIKAEANAARRSQLNTQIDNYSQEIDELYNKLENIENKINKL